MDTSSLSFVPLRRASLCLDCETITSAHSCCQACGSHALLNIARTLDRMGYRPVSHYENAVAHLAAPRRPPTPGDFAHST